MNSRNDGAGLGTPAAAEHRAGIRRRWRRPAALAGAAVVVVAGVVLAYALTGLAGPGGDRGDASTGAPSPSPAGSGGDSSAPSRWPAPSLWPGPDNTGVPDGTRLSAYTGSRNITKANTTIDGKTIDGCVQVRAANVTIRRSKITCSGELVVRVYDDANLTLEDSELDGGGAAMAIGYGDYTLRRVEIRNINEGPRVSSNTVIEDSWIHGLVRREGDHHDILQTTGGVKMVVRHNNLDAYDPQTRDPFNAAFMVGAETGQLADLLVEDNLMTGGNYTVNIRDDSQISGVVFRNNTFARNARYGPVTGQDTPGVTWERSNVFQDTGDPVG